MPVNRYAYCAALMFTAVSMAVYAQEKKIEPSALPAKVRKTVQEQSQGATVKGYSTEVEHGKRVYEAEMIINGHTKDIEVGADGAVKEIEEETDFHSLPSGVQAALTAKAAGAKITKVELLTEHGRLIAYEAATLRGTKKGEIQVGPDGGSLAHEE